MQYATVGADRPKQDIVLDDARSARSIVDVPNQFELAGNFPDPFSLHTKIVFFLPDQAFVRLAVHDLLGRRVAVLVEERLTAGEHAVTFEAAGLPKGRYLYRLSTPKGEFSRLMVLH